MKKKHSTQSRLSPPGSFRTVGCLSGKTYFCLSLALYKDLFRKTHLDRLNGDIFFTGKKMIQEPSVQGKYGIISESIILGYLKKGGVRYESFQ
jgi:hypothetical protein